MGLLLLIPYVILTFAEQTLLFLLSFVSGLRALCSDVIREED